MNFKKILLALMLMSFGLINVSGQEGSEEFQRIHNIIKPSVKEGFQLNAGQTSDSRFRYAFTYDFNNSELNRLIYSFMPGATEFSALAAALGGVEFEYAGRKAIYIDGKETGMSSISVLLNGGQGRFELSHRELGSMATFSKEQLLEILSSIPLEELEN